MNSEEVEVFELEQHRFSPSNPLVNSPKVHCRVYLFIRTLKVLSIKMSILISLSLSGSWLSYADGETNLSRSLYAFFLGLFVVSSYSFVIIMISPADQSLSKCEPFFLPLL